MLHMVDVSAIALVSFPWSAELRVITDQNQMFVGPYSPFWTNVAYSLHKDNVRNPDGKESI